MKIREQYKRLCELEKKDEATTNYNLFNLETLTKEEENELHILRQKFKIEEYKLFVFDYETIISKLEKVLEGSGFKLDVQKDERWDFIGYSQFDGDKEYRLTITYTTTFKKKDGSNEIVIPVNISYNSFNHIYLLMEGEHGSQFISPREIEFMDVEIHQEIAKVLPKIKDAIWETIEQKYYQEKAKEIKRTKEKIEKQKKEFEENQKKLKDELKKLEDSMEF